MPPLLQKRTRAPQRDALLGQSVACVQRPVLVSPYRSPPMAVQSGTHAPESLRLKVHCEIDSGSNRVSVESMACA